MPTNAWTPLANITLGSNTATVTFSSLSQAYRDLVLVTTLRSTRASSTEDYPALRFNGDSGNNYSVVFMGGNSGGTNTFSATQDAINLGDSPASSSTAGLQTMAITHIMDYSTTNKHKVALNRWNAPGAAPNYVAAVANRWANTGAITSLTISFPYYSGLIAAGSTIALYGVSA